MHNMYLTTRRIGNLNGSYKTRFARGTYLKSLNFLMLIISTVDSRPSSFFQLVQNLNLRCSNTSVMNLNE